MRSLFQQTHQFLPSAQSALPAWNANSVKSASDAKSAEEWVK